MGYIEILEAEAARLLATASRANSPAVRTSYVLAANVRLARINELKLRLQPQATGFSKEPC
jgi:hypothetical protein